MARITVPKIAPTQVLTTDMTTGFLSSADTALGSVSTGNIHPHSITRREVDWSATVNIGTAQDEVTGSSGVYSNTSWGMLTHGSNNTRLSFGSGLFLPAGTILRTHFSCGVTATTWDASQADDNFYFRWKYEDIDTTVTVPDSNVWGFSASLVNPGGTPATGETHNAAAYQTKAEAGWMPQYRRITLSGIHQFQADTSLSYLQWEFIVGHSGTEITIAPYQVWMTAHRV